MTAILPEYRDVAIERKRWTGVLVGAIKLVIFALLCWFTYYTFVSGNETLSAHAWHVEYRWLVVSGILYLAGMFPCAVFWFQVMRRAGQHVNFGESIRAYYISQLGKYVPGKWMVIVLRRALLSSPVENTVAAASVFLETFTMLAVGAAVATVILALWYSDQTLLIAAAFGSTLLLGVPSVPAVFQWLMHFLRVGKLNPTAGAKIRRVTARTIAIGWVTITIGWVLQGMSFWATLHALGAAEDGPFRNLSLHTAAVALGVVAGFISQLPGGIGMREWVSARLVEPQYGPSVAIVSAIIFRLVLLVSELTISIILYAVGWRRLRKPAAPAELTTSAQR